LTRHELKELEHDQFAVKVGSAVEYTKTHRQLVLRWAIIGLVAIAAIAGGFWFASYKRAERQADLRAAYEVAEASVGEKASPFTKSFSTQEAKDQAVLKAMAEVASKHSGSEEGYIAEYYVATLKASRGDTASAATNFKDVADSSAAVAAYAKLALAQIYMDQGKRAEAEALLRGLMGKPNGLVSKEQAEVVLAQLLAKKDPAASKKLLDSMDYQKMLKERPAIARAMDEARTGGPTQQ
jgi:hypothetical protein